jgi:hypothetical protein
MTEFNYKKYREYISNSPIWQEKRSAALDRAKHRCEFSCDCPDCHDPRHNRCKETTGLQVHHRHYQTLYHERPEDLMVVCRYHHAVMTVADQKCNRCGECSYATWDDAEVEVKSELDMGMSLQDVMDAVTAHYMDDFSPWHGPLCDYCDYMTGKDD